MTILLEELDLTNMPITAVLRNWMINEDWKDKIEISEDGNEATVATILTIKDQDHRLYIEVAEKSDVFFLYLYGHFNVPINRRTEVIQLINRAHGRIGLGRFHASMDEKPRPVQFKYLIDLEGSSLSTKQIDVMLASAASSCELYGPLFAKVAMTDVSAEDVWAEFLETERQQEEQQEALGPAQL